MRRKRCKETWPTFHANDESSSVQANRVLVDFDVRQIYLPQICARLVTGSRPVFTVNLDPNLLAALR